ncbi:helix-turn-helix domain-containing protein [Caproicibacter sp. BJN0012]|uniref:helix-turn-helix domain-containing protein n=1 Tax=Caproicibacter sp. BJN0012 TaxID=3110227 RepID=UPI002E0FB462
MDRKSIGRRIQAYRETAGMSQEELAEKLGLSTIYISTIERGVRTPSLEVFVDIVNALNVSADLLLVDVLRNGYKIKASKLSEEIDTMTAEDRERVFKVIEAMVAIAK